MDQGPKQLKWPQKGDILEYEWGDVLGSSNPLKFMSNRGFHFVPEIPVFFLVRKVSSSFIVLFIVTSFYNTVNIIFFNNGVIFFLRFTPLLRLKIIFQQAFQFSGRYFVTVCNYLSIMP
jgi:hypothetical protein